MRVPGSGGSGQRRTSGTPIRANKCWARCLFLAGYPAKSDAQDAQRGPDDQTKAEDEHQKSQIRFLRSCRRTLMFFRCAEAMPLRQPQFAPSSEVIRRPKIIGLGVVDTGREVTTHSEEGTLVVGGIDTLLLLLTHIVTLRARMALAKQRLP